MKNENKEQAEGTKKIEDSIKILVTREAENILGEAIKRISDGFEGGRISRQAIASWLIKKACQDLTDADIKLIRAENFNATNALAALVRRVQETGVFPRGIEAAPFKRSRT